MKMYIYHLMTDQVNDPLSKFFKGALWLMSLVYGLGVKIVLFFYNKGLFKRYSLEKPVISVGNITVGGVGKTPLVQYIAQFLKENNIKPAILIRGYMEDKFFYISPDNQMSDEALLLKTSLKDVPVLVGPNRRKAAQQVPADYPVDVFLLDDGFQHWKLSRNMDIVAIDSTNPFGNKSLIPRGVLREPMSSLSRADFYLLSKADAGESNLTTIRSCLKTSNAQTPIVEAVHQPVALIDLNKPNQDLALSILKGQSVCSFCSIADPNSFSKTLASIGADVKKSFAFIDHHVYRQSDIDKILSCCREHNLTTIVTTQKDAVKIDHFSKQFGDGFSLYSLKIKMSIIQGKDQLHNKILDICKN